MHLFFLFSKKALLIAMLFMFFVYARADKPLGYFLPAINYDQSIPTPGEFLGYQIGDWHLHHAPLVQYMQLLADHSDRAIIYEYARTHEHRPLVHMVITSPENHGRLDTIRERHLALADPSRSTGIDIGDMPVVVRLGYGVHGNEPSAHNAAPLVAYYLIAGQDEEVERMLERMVVIIDPSKNPDGQDRFASWVNRHQGRSPNPDPESREFRDVWPGSRTNHYWFDLNRDWLPVQQPEASGWVREFHRWKPNVNTDHHEFGANSTFYFQPGIPGRTNPFTPRRTDALTMEIARYHGRAFDAMGQFYYTEEDFDDFYYGKGSSYPDVNGSIGILFEQAGTKGHIRETSHGVIDFAHTIRNQVAISLSTMEAAIDMRETLLEHLRWFYRSAIDEARQHPTKAYIFGDNHDQSRNAHLLDILRKHQIEVFDVTRDHTSGNHSFIAGKAWLVPLDQPQFRLIRSVFETALEFEDTLFYDVSTWTKPLAFNIPYAEINNSRQLSELRGSAVEQVSFPAGRVVGGKSGYAYLFSWDDFYAPRALYHLQKKGLMTRVATRPLTMAVDGEPVEFDYGSILVPVPNQHPGDEYIFRVMQEAAEMMGSDIYAVHTSFSEDGINLGSGGFVALQKPEILMVTGQDVNSREAGEAWHLLDFRFGIPVTMVDHDQFNGLDLSRYNTILLMAGNYGRINDNGKSSLDRFVRGGGTIVATSNANSWLHQIDFAKTDFREMPEVEDPVTLPYYLRGRYLGARRIPGSIYRGRIDTTHPVGYGYKRSELPVYISGQVVAKPDKSPFNNPLIYESNGHMSGYMYESFRSVYDEAAGVIIHSRGRGKVISIMDNPNFRGFWFGTNRIYLNSIFFGPVIR